MVKSWPLLPASTKKRLTKKAAILGPESSGKSTLAKKLAEHLGSKLVEEYGREFVEAGGICDDRGFQRIATEHDRRVRLAVEESNYPVVICDTDWVTTKVFYDLYTDKSNEKIGAPTGALDFSLFDFVHYDLRIVLHPGNLEGVQDGTRNFLLERLKHYKMITGELEFLGLPYISIESGDTAFSKSLEIIESFLGCKLN
jgi:HTH-type transcriptional repressor of NAD biosynthesis genes